MKKFLIILVIFILNFIGLHAQKFGIEGGVGISKSKFSGYEEPGTIDKKGIFGYCFGPAVKFELSGKFDFATALLYSSKGYKYEYTFNDLGFVVNSETVVRINYLELPLVINYTIEQFKIPIIIGVGPVPAIALFGNMEVEGSTDMFQYADSQSIKFGSGEGKMKLFDLGFLFSAGARIKSTDIKLFYNLGLTNVLNEDIVKHRVIGLSVSQWFGKKTRV